MNTTSDSPSNSFQLLTNRPSPVSERELKLTLASLLAAEPSLQVSADQGKWGHQKKMFMLQYLTLNTM